MTTSGTRRFKTLTKLQSAQQAKLRKAIDVAVAAIYAGEMHTPFNQMYLVASDSHREAYAKAVSALQAFECEMVAEGRGYFDRWHIFRAY